MLQPWMIPDDLAPGDRRSLETDWRGFELHRIHSEKDPRFTAAFDALREEFGEKDELEQPEILAARLGWNPNSAHDGCSFLYELQLITLGEAFVGVRDHTAIVRPGCKAAVVHMSHNLVAPAFRRTGIAGWLRALPVQGARRCLSAAGAPTSAPICMVGEMEPADPEDAPRMIRLGAYEKAGYKKVDPGAVAYLQPDFRPPETIDSGGGPRPLRLDLLLRFVGAEERDSIPSGELHAILTSLYRMYAMSFRKEDMEPLWRSLAGMPIRSGAIRLLPPTFLQ